MDGLSAAHFRSLSLVGLHLLSRLERITLIQNDDQLLSLIACVASFTDQREAWSSSAASEQAKIILDHILKFEGRQGRQRTRNILTDLLQGYVKPAFVKFKHASITSQGRKVTDPTPSRVVPHEPEEKTKPWKFNRAHTVSMYAWILRQSDVKAPPVSFYLVSGLMIL